MKLFQLLLLGFFCVVKIYGQSLPGRGNRIVVEITKEKKVVYTKVQLNSSFPGVDSAWLHSLETEISKSILQKKRIKKGKYIVSVVFLVSKDGTLSDMRCEKEPVTGLCDEVVRVLKKSKKWVPAKQVEVKSNTGENQ